MSLFKNQKGSALIYSMLGLSILVGASLFMMQKSKDHKLEQSELAKTQYERLFKKKLTTILKDPDVCARNFEGVSLEESRPNILDSNGYVLFQMDKFYYGSTLKIGRVTARKHISPTPGVDPTPETHFTLEVPLFKTRSKNIEAQTQMLRFNMEATYADSANPVLIQTCKLAPAAAANVDDAIAHLCQGPGMVSNTGGECHFVDLSPTAPNPAPGLSANCPAGQAIKSISFDSTTNKLVASCAQIITDHATCPFGVKYTGVAGEFDCVNLSEVVNTATQPVGIGSTCGVDVVSGQYVFTCGPVAVVPPSDDPVDPGDSCDEPACVTNDMVCVGQGTPWCRQSRCGVPCPKVVGAKICTNPNQGVVCVSDNICSQTPCPSGQVWEWSDPACAGQGTCMAPPGEDCSTYGSCQMNTCSELCKLNSYGNQHVNCFCDVMSGQIRINCGNVGSCSNQVYCINPADDNNYRWNQGYTLSGSGPLCISQGADGSGFP